MKVYSKRLKLNIRMRYDYTLRYNEFVRDRDNEDISLIVLEIISQLALQVLCC